MKNGSFSALTLFYWDFFLFGPAEIAKDKVFSRGVCRWMNTPFASSSPSQSSNGSTERLSFKSVGRFTCRRLTFTVKSRATGAAGLPFAQWCLKDLRYRSWNLFLLFLVALAIFIRICARASTHTRNAYLVAVQIESQLIMKYYRCAAPFQCSRISRWCDT